MNPDQATLDHSYSPSREPGIDPTSSDGRLPEPEWTGERCEKCQTPMKSRQATVCRHCGWYALLGTFMEVAPEWETDEAIPVGQTARPVTVGDHVRVWINLLPRWSWWVIGCVALVVAESFAVRLLTPAESTIRMTWSLSQLAIGAMAVAVCHFATFLAASSDDTELGLLDLLLKPIKIWSRTITGLPAGLWRLNTAASGLVAVIMVFLVIGGLPYERLWDWGFKAPPKQDLAGAVMSQVQKARAGEKKKLEEAVGALAGTADGVEGEATNKSATEALKPRKKMECVILGYLAHENGQVHTLLLGTEIYGKLAYAGSVYPKLNEAQLIDLSENLAGIKKSRPLLNLRSTDAVWVEPKFVCSVSYTKQEPNGRLTEITWDDLVGQLRL